MPYEPISLSLEDWQRVDIRYVADSHVAGMLPFLEEALDIFDACTEQYMLKKLVISIILFVLLTPCVADTNTETFVSVESLGNAQFCISSVEYNIKGLTMESVLRDAVPIHRGITYKTHTEFLQYVAHIEASLRNIRTIETVSISPLYRAADENNISEVHLIIYTKDSFNFIAIPYPKYDSNSGFLFKIKAKDNNFLGTMQPLTFDWDLQLGTNKFTGIFFDFSFPYKAGPLLASQQISISTGTNFAPFKNFSFELTSKSQFQYKYKRLSVVFGLEQGFAVNALYGAYIGSKGYKYYLPTSLFLKLPLFLTQVGDFGALLYTPQFLVSKKWAFTSSSDAAMQGFDISFGHSLDFGNVTWKKNFREGLTFSLSNDYTINTKNKPVPSIGLSTQLTGYFSLLDRIGFYGRFSFFSRFFSQPTSIAAEYMRGILNDRLLTDMAFVFNFDIPIRLFDFDFEKITGYGWTRYFGFQLQVSPFLDIAFAHDLKTGRYFSYKDWWCSGGLEVIVYPVKFRSIYVRASLGFDLLELKNVPGILKVSGTATRDGKGISEIFIGIGLHY